MPDKNIYTMVVAVDFELDGERALDAAIDMAERYGKAGTHAVIHVLHVDPSLAAQGGSTVADPRSMAERNADKIEELEQHCRMRLDAARKRKGGELESTRMASHLRLGNPADHIVQLAVDLDADIVIVGTHGLRGVKRLLLGSVAAKVLKLARCPVLVARAKDHQGLGEVPEIEAACGECVAARRASSGQTWWCEAHSHERPEHAHHYSYVYNAGPGSSRAPWGPSMD